MSFDRTRYQRLYARRRRAEKLAELNRASRFCRKAHGKGVCGGLLESVILDGGRVEIRCPRCVRVAAGVCVDCPAPVAGRVGYALRKTLNRKAKRRARRERVPMATKKRLWRLANPEKVQAQKRRYALRGKAALAQRRRRANGVVGLAKGSTGPRTCLTCPATVSGRTKKCAACKERDRVEALRQLRVVTGRAA